MERLKDMALFVEVVKAMGFRGAALATGIPNSTLSRRVSALEKAMGLRLLHRTTRKLELTEAGQQYFDRCKRIVDEATLAHEQLGEMLEHPTGVLRVSLPVDFAQAYLAPLIAEFAGSYPGIQFDVDLTPRRVDLVTEPFDVAIRMGESEDSALVARPLARLPTYCYASPGYLAKAGEPGEPADLSAHECLRFRGSGAATWPLFSLSDRTERSVEIGGRFQLNSVGMMRRLATLDLGIVQMPEAMVSEDLAQGRLRRVLPLWQGAPVPVYAMTETRLLPAKTQHFIAFLRERLGPT
ncbi:MAG: LysR family transcriptional regulator [Burkholderiaceae bacterium]|nr:LysR family transcriptional regulator [Burkholderiaceae bacterium]